MICLNKNNHKYVCDDDRYAELTMLKAIFSMQEPAVYMVEEMNRTWGKMIMLISSPYCGNIYWKGINVRCSFFV